MADKKDQSPIPDIQPGPNQNHNPDRVNRIADDMAIRGRERQQKDESGDIIVESDPHGSNP
ncbi:MAG: hypothetical protein WBQ79_09965 [Acidobacteriaceae bacterium]